MNGTQKRQSRGYSKIFNTMWCMVLLLVFFTASCKKDNYKGAVVGLCPIVVSTDPMDNAVDVVLNKVVSATFNVNMDSTTINKTTFIIKQGATLISGAVATTPIGTTFTFKPDVALLPFTTYTGTITTGATNRFRTTIVDNYVWSFTTMPQVTLSSNPVAGGTTVGGGTFAQGSLVTVTATPNAGYSFTNWTNNGAVVSTSSSYQFKMAGNMALVANFAAVKAGSFAVNLSSNPTVGGTTNGAGAYVAGTPVTVTATPNTGYTFINWTENGAVVSASSSYQFILTGNRTLVANYKVISASQLAVILSSNPAAGGTTTGSGAYNAGSSVTVTATPNNTYTFGSWTENGNVVSTSASYTFPITVSRTLVANFILNTYTLNVTAVNGAVAKNPNQPTYNNGTTVQLTATANPGYTFTSWSGDATGSVNPLTVTMDANKNITANFTLTPAIGPGQVFLGAAGNFAILTKSGISTTGITSVQGDIGVSPAAATAITGFGLIMDASGQFSQTPIVTGKVYASDYAAPTPSNMTTSINDMQTAYTTANGLVTPAPIVDLYAGNISGHILPPGLYKYSTGVLITSAGVTLAGGPNDTWVIQIAQDLTVNNSAIVTLTGGAQAKNITWVVAGQATLGTNTDFSGIILSKTLISLNTGAKVTGRLLAQTAVTLNASTVILP
ncbi:MAG: cell wall/surface repeat protein [Mucilaginibacter sp.]|nr:cell wall/surface repeat protein [Mucilaginibacter sp.]